MEEKTVSKTHKVLLQNRKSGSFSGIVDVLSFDVAEILLETELGMLLIKGNDLHVNRLSLEKGEVDVEGRIDGGMAVGMLCYNRFVSPFFVKYMALIFGTVFRILRRVAGILCRPLKKLKKILKKIVRLVKIGLCKL